MKIEVPSGKVFYEEDINILRLMAEYGFVCYSKTPFKLKSGIMSNVYVFGREDLTDNPDLEWFIGHRITTSLWEAGELRIGASKQPCLIGIPTAGTALAQAAAMVTWYEQWFRYQYPKVIDTDYFEKRSRDKYKTICHRLMRETLKQHGAHHTWVNGKPDPCHSYWLVDNVATDGQSKIEAAEKLTQDGYLIEEVSCLIFIDRQQGAIPRLKKETKFKQIVVVYNLLDITYALGELGLWPKDSVKAVEEEIKAHQFI